jgi:DmsE family decaheme c-type cytochrome
MWALVAAVVLSAAAYQAAPRSEKETTAEAPASVATATTQDGGGEDFDALCADCHAAEAEAFANNPHSVLSEPGWGAGWGDASGGQCTSCHYGAEEHINQGGGIGTIFAFNEEVESPAARTQACTSCHAGAHPSFGNTAHANAGLSCTDCHNAHGNSAGLLRASVETGAWDPDDLDDATATCADCHGDVLANFQFNERHRLQEGILSCASCHDPHQPAQRVALGGFKQDACIDCHTDKGGPFVFEHGSVKVEGCTACHTPHGSPNRHMLTFQSVAELCFSCHAGVPGFHARFTLDTVCTNCHSAIHGSNFHPAFLK